MSTELSEQEVLRRQAAEQMRALGINPYPAPLYNINAHSKEILEKYPKDNTLFQEVSIAGRIMSRRIMGAASFAVIQDSVGKIQLYIKRDEICEGEDKTMYNTVFKKLLDIGDIIGVNNVSQLKKDIATTINNPQKLNPAVYLTIDDLQRRTSFA